jgi:hypothetical protein
MPKVIAILLFTTLLSVPVIADASPLVGTFGHAYTSNKIEPVWTMTENKGVFNLRFHSDNSVRQLKILSSADRQKFWQKMWWKSSSHIKAICVGDETSTMICSVSKAERASQPDLKSLQSDIFYYDSGLGLIEMVRLGKSMIN